MNITFENICPFDRYLLSEDYLKFLIENFYLKIMAVLKFTIFTFLIAVVFRQVKAHGRMEDPPARNCAWRFGFNVPANYNDNELNCGGSGQQHARNGIDKIS